jgi:class 3 adenylate cyclase/YHS domain-containing protein
MEKRQLTLRQLSEQTGEAIEKLGEWRSLGLIGGEDPAAFPQSDLERVRLVQYLLRRGISAATLAQAEKQDRFLARYVELRFPGGMGPTYSLREGAEIIGSDLDTVQRYWDAAGLSEQGDVLYEEDMQALKAFKIAAEAGFPEEGLLQLARVYADALGRVAEAESRLFHFYVHDRLRAQGRAGRALTQADVASSDQMFPLVEPAILYFHRKGRQRAVKEDALMHLQDAAFEHADVPGRLRVATVFVDLSSFTPLTEAMGDDAAAQVLQRFSRLVRDAAKRCDGRVVKQIGDAFMLVFPEAQSAVTCALEIDAQAAAEPQFPAVRSGVHWGPVLYREGDYVGASVNLAARLAGAAKRHQVLVTAEVRREASGLFDAHFVPLGRRRLKGVTDEVELFAVARMIEGKAPARLVDPVCAMELDLGEVAARLSLEDQELVFCSPACLQRFVAAPERYRGGGDVHS